MIPKSEVQWNNERSLLKTKRSIKKHEKFVRIIEKRCMYYKTVFIAANAGTFPHIRRRLEASEMWLYRRVLRIPLTEHGKRDDV